MEEKNIILITVDCLRPDHLSCYGYHKETSPTIDCLSEEGALIRNCFATSSFTPSSFLSLFCSIYPLDYGDYTPLPKEAKPFYEVLRENGYKTIGINSNVWLTDAFGYQRGFDRLLDLGGKSKKKIYLIKNKIKRIISQNLGDNVLAESFNKFEKLVRLFVINKSKVPYTPANKLTDEVIKAIKENKRNKFFIWAHFMDLHLPRCVGHIKPNRFISLTKKEQDRLNSLIIKNPKALEEKDMNKIIKIYDENIYYVDRHIKIIIDELKKLGLYEKTILIITSDHGEEFKEHNKFDHANRLYDELMRVPLIIKDSKNQKKNDNLISLIDLPYTILKILNLKIPRNYKGRDFYNKQRKEIFCEVLCDKKYNPTRYDAKDKQKIFCVRDRSWKLIWNKTSGRMELFYIKEDKKEEEDLSKNKQETVKEYRDKIERYFSYRNKKWKEKEKPQSLEKEEEMIKNRLKELGYM